MTRDYKEDKLEYGSLDFSTNYFNYSEGAIILLMFQVLQERLFPFSSLHAHYLKHHTIQCIVAK